MRKRKEEQGERNKDIPRDKGGREGGREGWSKRTSSKKMIQAFLLRAIVKSSRTMRAPSPTYFCTSSEPMTRIKQASVLLATARADRVYA